MQDQNLSEMSQRAQSCLDSGQLGEAMTLYTKLCELDPTNAEAWLMQGAISAESGNAGKGIDCILKAIAADPKYPEAHLTLATLYNAQGKFEDARELAQRTVEIDADYDEAWVLLSAIHGTLGDFSQAKDCASRALELWPDCLDAFVNLANSLIALDDYENAIINYQQAVKLSPSNAELYYNLATANLKLAHYSQALTSSQQAINIQPHYAEAYAVKGAANFGLKKIDDALQAYNKSLEFKPDMFEALSGACILSFNLEQYIDAHKFCIDALASKPNSADMLYWLGRIYEKLDNFSSDDAAKKYKQAIDIQPDHALSNYHLALIIEKESESEAEQHYRTAVEADNSNDTRVNALAAVQLGNICMRNNKPDDAISYFQYTLEIMPDHAGAKHFLSVLGKLPTPDRANRDYVVALFDDMADDFEQHLVNDLNYHIPELIRDTVKRIMSAETNNLRILDLGCGTGLTGNILKDQAEYLAGIDLSPKMIEKSKEKGIYNMLIEGDLDETMSEVDETFSLIVSSDVFNYLGDLSSVIDKCAALLQDAGLLIFSIEIADDDVKGYKLLDSGRYAQSNEYLESISRQAGFSIVETIETPIRNDYGKPINGLLYVFRKD